MSVPADEITSRIFLLGAGFSRPAGLPLASELLELVREVAHRYLRAPGQSSHLEIAIADYEQYLADTEPTRPFDLEEFGAWLDWEYVLRLEGSDRWSDDGSRPSLQLRWAIGRVLHHATPTTLPEVYLEFARRLTTSDVVLTLNYDTILERALHHIGIPFRRFPERYESINEYAATVDTSHPTELRVNKLHGSLDWVRIPTPRNATVPSRPLVAGPRQPTDPLLAVGVIPESALDDYYERRANWHEAAPLILAPSTAKPLGGSPFVPLWEGLTQGSYLWGSFAIIGCSLPTGDPYVRQVSHRIATQIGASLDKGLELPWPQTQMKVVDYRQDRVGIADLRNRYRFMPPEHTDFVLAGFSLETLDEILPPRN